jgi:hypothetical protein
VWEYETDKAWIQLQIVTFRHRRAEVTSSQHFLEAISPFAFLNTTRPLSTIVSHQTLRVPNDWIADCSSIC